MKLLTRSARVAARRRTAVQVVAALVFGAVVGIAVGLFVGVPLIGWLAGLGVAFVGLSGPRQLTYVGRCRCSR